MLNSFVQFDWIFVDTDVSRENSSSKHGASGILRGLSGTTGRMKKKMIQNSFKD